MNDLYWAARKAEHDATGEHVWVDATVVGDTDAHHICRFCQAEEWVPREPVDAGVERR